MSKSLNNFKFLSLASVIYLAGFTACSGGNTFVRQNGDAHGVSGERPPEEPTRIASFKNSLAKCLTTKSNDSLRKIACHIEVVLDGVSYPANEVEAGTVFSWNMSVPSGMDIPLCQMSENTLSYSCDVNAEEDPYFIFVDFSKISEENPTPVIQKQELLVEANQPEIVATVDSNTWSAISIIGAPSPRGGGASVWTGSKMIVWGGGQPGYNTPNDGGAYDPVTNSWNVLDTTNAPAGKYAFGYAWSPSFQTMFVWGGGDIRGGRYDAITEKWSPMSTVAAPGARQYMTGSCWTGNKFLVWGGGFQNTGGLYDPQNNSWSLTNTAGAPPGKSGGNGVWTGDKFMVFGGAGNNNIGGLYDPSNNSWTLTKTIGAPSPRDSSFSTWTGTHVIIWSGTGAAVANTGGLYNPLDNSWTPISTTGAPAASHSQNPVWTGTKMIVWGGGSLQVNSGGIYDPSTNVWSSMSTIGAPMGASMSYSVWTGSKALFWGGAGANFSSPKNTGGVYTP